MTILVISNNIKNISAISNFINLNFNNNISILIANDMNSANSIINKYNINLIILESNIYNFNFYKEHLSYIPVILFTDTNNYNKKIFKDYENISLCNLSYLKNLLFNYISLTSSIESTKIEIINQLLKIGFNIKHNGTKYITDSIIIYKFFFKTDKIKDIYSIVAQKYNTTSNNVKSNILKSINYMYCETKFEKLKTYFSLEEDIKPTPKQIILTVLKNI